MVVIVPWQLGEATEDARARARHLDGMRRVIRLKECPVDWAVTGSLGMVLRGVPVDIRDIAIQTDKGGVYELEQRFSDCLVKAVRLSESERIRLSFGVLEVGGIGVDTMGDIQKRLEDGQW